MDDTLAQVQAKCALQLEMYQRCVESNPQNWDKACVQQKRALTKCSEENVGILKFVKQHCGKQIKDYDECLAANSEEPEKCIPALKELYFCTEATSAAYRNRKPETASPSSDATTAATPAKPSQAEEKQ